MTGNQAGSVGMGRTKGRHVVVFVAMAGARWLARLALEAGPEIGGFEHMTGVPAGLGWFALAAHATGAARRREFRPRAGVEG